MLTSTIFRAAPLWFVWVAGCAAFELPADAGTDGGAGGTGGNTMTTGLPCDVASVLEAHCVSCHGSPPAADAVISLLSYADLTAPSTVDPRMTVADRCSIRMKDAQRPMPPGAGVTVPASQVAAFDAWIQAGTPMGSCKTSDPFAGPPVCSSHTTWSGESGAEMDPGKACLTCHGGGGEAPRLTVAGTIFPTGHEPDLCVAAASEGALLKITEANGFVLFLGVNSSGNFSTGSAIALPYTATVMFQGRERPMVAAQTDGDCNRCHSQNGSSGAPGRIVLP